MFNKIVNKDDDDEVSFINQIELKENNQTSHAKQFTFKEQLINCVLSLICGFNKSMTF